MPDNEQTASVIIVPDDIGDQVRSYAASLAQERSAEVEGFAMGASPNLAGLASLLGNPARVVPAGVNMLSGDECSGTGGFKPTDFNCATED